MSRYAVISDIHGNLHAFQAVLLRLAEFELDGVICLGDIVGYGANPGECIDLVVTYATHVVRGNHDTAVVDPVCADLFNGAAREAVYWTRSTLGPMHLDALNRLPSACRIGAESGANGSSDAASHGVVMCIHDSPWPGPTDYVHDKLIAAEAFRGVDAWICLLGHTHVPMVFEAPDSEPASQYGPTDVTAYLPNDELPVRLEPGRRYICNPGSVGQPRDCDPRASFAILDLAESTFTVHRQEYDIASAQRATQQAGLPTILADRLAIGA